MVLLIVHYLWTAIISWSLERKKKNRGGHYFALNFTICCCQCGQVVIVKSLTKCQNKANLALQFACMQTNQSVFIVFYIIRSILFDKILASAFSTLMRVFTRWLGQQNGLHNMDSRYDVHSIFKLRPGFIPKNVN